VTEFALPRSWPQSLPFSGMTGHRKAKLNCPPIRLPPRWSSNDAGVQLLSIKVTPIGGVAERTG
jgi:hypothetical protein